MSKKFQVFTTDNIRIFIFIFWPVKEQIVSRIRNAVSIKIGRNKQLQRLKIRDYNSEMPIKYIKIEYFI